MTYFDWLAMIVMPDFHQRDSYIELLTSLYSTEFFWRIARDQNRAEDGLELRNEYEYDTGLYCDIYGPCSCLEMMIALAIRCEKELMYDPDIGDRTDQWFWAMITNLGLDKYDDDNFNFEEVDDTLYRFMNRNYGPNGQFCAFYVKKTGHKFDKNFEKMELAYQINHYIMENFY